MKRCRHGKAGTSLAGRRGRRVWRMGGGDVMAWFTAASWESPDSIVCPDCHAWLPLGPSNDSPEEVRVEIRAAEIASFTTRYGYVGKRSERMTLHEGQGWWHCSNGGHPRAVELAGWLAHEIATHAALTPPEAR